MNDAKQTLLHYFLLITEQAGQRLDADCVAEIEGIVDDILDAAYADARVYCDKQIAALRQELNSAINMIGREP